MPLVGRGRLGGSGSAVVFSGITSTFCGLIHGLIAPFLSVGAPKAVSEQEGVPAEGFPVLPLVASLEFSACRVVSSSD